MLQPADEDEYTAQANNNKNKRAFEGTEVKHKSEVDHGVSNSAGEIVFICILFNFYLNCSVLLINPKSQYLKCAVGLLFVTYLPYITKHYKHTIPLLSYRYCQVRGEMGISGCRQSAQWPCRSHGTWSLLSAV